MTEWIVVALLGGLVGLDATSFPQAMISRPLVAGAVTGALFGRPIEGVLIGFIMEAFALIILPVGAARYPESGTATVAGVAAYGAAAAPGLQPGGVALVVALALLWEWLAGESVVAQRRSNGRLLAREGAIAPAPLERRHLAAMGLDFARGAVLAVTGGAVGYVLLGQIDGVWGLPPGATFGVLAVLAAGMVGTTLTLFGGLRARRVALGLGLAAGLVLALVL